LQGEVDEVKVWRLHAYIDTAFLSRPADRSIAECWDDFFRRLAASFDRNPECALQTLQTIDDVLAGFPTRRRRLAIGNPASVSTGRRGNT
jgi:hypothetical protein